MVLLLNQRFNQVYALFILQLLAIVRREDSIIHQRVWIAKVDTFSTTQYSASPAVAIRIVIDASDLNVFNAAMVTT